METPEATRTVARWYAEQGWRVFPVQPGSKRPAIAEWPTVATADVAQVDEWWSNGYAGHGIGIVCGSGSDLLVVDIDSHKGGDDTFEDWCDQHGSCPETPTVLTPSGGRHVYFHWPDLEVRQDAIGEAVDVQGAGRFVVAPPSGHPTGGEYVWEASSRPSEVPLADIPPAWRDALGQNTPAGAPAHLGECDHVLKAAGFSYTRTDHDGANHYTRPGKNPRDGTSATVWAHPDHHACIWSSSVPGIETNRPYYHLELARLLGVSPVEDTSRSGRLYVARRADTIEPERPEWVWPGYLARNIFQVAIGRQGGGKSTFASWVVGQVTTGRPLSGGQPTDPADCLYLSMEESDGRVVARLNANGADLARVVVMDRTLVDGLPWRLPGAAGVLEQAIGDHQVRLAIVDGVGYCIDGKQDYPNVATCCSMLVTVAERTGSTILGLTHPPKGQSDPVTAAIGSTAWTAVPRLTWLIGRDPDDENQRVVRVGKTAFLEPDAGVGFTIDNDDLWDVGVVHITGPSTVPKAALVAGLVDQREQSTRDEIAELLTEWTESGPIAVDEVRRRLAADGYSVSHKTIQRAARKAGLATSDPDGLGGPRHFERDQTQKPSGPGPIALFGPSLDTEWSKKISDHSDQTGAGSR
jgi:hypothetical protein